MFDKLIPSQPVRAYMARTGFCFSDEELAALIYHAAQPMWVKHRFWKDLQGKTADAELWQQIQERVEYDHKCYALFWENGGGYFYETVTEEGGSALGHFAFLAAAVAAGRETGLGFYVQKYQIVGRCKRLIMPQILIDPRLLGGNRMKEQTYCGDPVAEFYYDAVGALRNYWSWEAPPEEIAAIEGWGGRRFEQRFVRMPNPFEAGDRVRIVGTDRVGVVTTSQTQWRAFLQRVAEGSFAVDYSNAAVTVEFSSGGHDHLPPICLDRVGVEQTSPENETERK